MSPKIKSEENTVSIGSSELFNVVNKGLDIQIENPATQTLQVTPPKLVTRNKYGLIEDQTLNYIFNDDGTINWRKMVKVEHLVPKNWLNYILSDVIIILNESRFS